MRKHLLWLLCVALPAGAQDWLALTLYPGGDLYQAGHLQQLVGATQNLWEVKDGQGRTPIQSLDSLASTNAIATQGDDVRFRRLIETRELTPAGLKTLAGLVETHPLLGPRLVTAQHDGTHFWLRLAQPYAKAEKAELLLSYAKHLAADFNPNCRVASGAQGALEGFQLNEWTLQAEGAVPSRTATLQALQQATVTLRERSLQAYSAADILAYLRQVLNGESGLPASDDEVGQLYLIAESLRSRDLQDLARPDFQRLKVVVLGRQRPDTPSLPGYRLDTTARWSSTPNSYLTVDCR
ncbi:hypothetical protein IB234_14255 [Pseudomonas sp. PDM16]|uniref:hypothetical protein n=1 Tax=Pseudomonas sp. PDM16 TaxID=2769292 RepID=UPI00177AD847|nr:hypothetical protein [Pseudomonas sp. PDM16]MBD9415720.1 hypothetical protein [Pseudomonas sp. PDM16]